MKRRIVLLMLVLVSIVLTTDKAVVRSQERVQEEFHQTYQLAPQGRVSLENINGAVRIVGWDRNEVRVDAVKWAYTRERLAEAEIKVESSSDAIRIWTNYPEQNQTFTNDRQGRLNNPATVEYTLTVPRNARIESVELINGGLNIEGLSGDVHASSINGKVEARGLTGEARLSTINGNLDANFNQLDASKPISLTSVNGNVTITIPSDANATIKASTVHGGITNDFGLPVRKGEYVGNDLAGQLGQGSARIKLANVNGAISIRRAQDGRAQSQAVSLLTIRDKDEDNVREEVEEAVSEVRAQTREAVEAQRDARREQREIQRAQRDAQRIQRDAQREAREAQREIERESRQISEGVGRGVGYSSYRLQERDSKSFAVSGVPRVSVETFDGNVMVRAWDKQEVSYSAMKRAGDEENMRAIRITAEQRGDEIIIRADFDKAVANRLNNVQAMTSFEVYVPRRANLRVASGDGPLSIAGVSGELSANTGDGAVDVRDGEGHVTVKTGDGRIRIYNFTGTATANTGDGGISLDGRFTRIAANTGDGTISLSLPGDANATIETDAEIVVSDGLATGEAGEETDRVRRWRVGNGGNLMKLKTGDGRIYLRRSGGAQSSATP